MKKNLNHHILEKNDILVLIKTKENRRFGGYVHESFLLDVFDKEDWKAFLFNIDNKKIYQSRGKSTSIWRHIGYLDSMNFGGGTDLRIFHKFLSNKCYTSPTFDYDYNNENYALNGTKYFDVSILELYKVNFN